MMSEPPESAEPSLHWSLDPLGGCAHLSDKLKLITMMRAERAWAWWEYGDQRNQMIQNVMELPVTRESYMWEFFSSAAEYRRFLQNCHLSGLPLISIKIIPNHRGWGKQTAHFNKQTSAILHLFRFFGICGSKCSNASMLRGKEFFMSGSFSL